MAARTEKPASATSDLCQALQIALSKQWPQILTAWLYVPIGIFVTLAACLAVDKILKLGNVAFPASVACLLLLFLALLLSERVLGEHRTRKIVAKVDISAGWSLRWMNMFFTPSFVLLPLSEAVTVVEVFKIIAVFVLGFLFAMAFTAYMTRALQMIFGHSKRAMTARAEELGDSLARDSGEDIPMSDTPRTTDEDQSSPTPEQSSGASTPGLTLTPPERSQTSSHIGLVSAELENMDGATSPTQPMPLQTPPPPPRARVWAAIITLHLDTLTYLCLFLFIGIPIWFGTGYSMPIQLTFSTLIFFGASSLPASWRQFLHPVLVCALFTVLGLWVIGLTRGESLHESLTEYKTGAKYLALWEGSKLLPGAGDMLASALDASIVALALPMYQYRRELKQHFFVIVIPNIAISIASLFIYPIVCYRIGISATRSLAIVVRSLTLALATPAADNLGGDTNTASAVAIMSGIVGALVGLKILRWLRIPDDDYVTRGVTLGANSSAIATAVLLRTDPRAAALSSLSMSLFGTITVLFTSIPPIVSIIRGMVGL